jgi:hypothetical protein
MQVKWMANDFLHESILNCTAIAGPGDRDGLQRYCHARPNKQAGLTVLYKYVRSEQLMTACNGFEGLD